MCLKLGRKSLHFGFLSVIRDQRPRGITTPSIIFQVFFLLHNRHEPSVPVMMALLCHFGLKFYLGHGCMAYIWVFGSVNTETDAAQHNKSRCAAHNRDTNAQLDTGRQVCPHSFANFAPSPICICTSSRLRRFIFVDEKKYVPPKMLNGRIGSNIPASTCMAVLAVGVPLTGGRWMPGSVVSQGMK